ncbi:unnamed protein product [Pelagomonas calceolata]|uniref:Uncharacterized protein n=1 Tax=Pelagomonas calceolata TaxID=35677 RepID=A0A8J2WFL3_9STRA|nr:unnamed protein product [Pelagomonas calceolata]
MLNINPLAALKSTFGRRKSTASRLYHIKSGPLAQARENVRRVHRQVADFERSCARRELDERHPTLRYVRGFFAAVRHHEKALSGYNEDNVEAHDSLEQATNHLIEAVSTYSTLDPSEFQAQLGVALLSAVRGLNCREAFAQYQADLKAVTEDRLGRAVQREKVKTEGYTDRKGKEHSPAEIAARAERGRQCSAMPGGRDVALESRTSAGGRGLQNEAATNASMRSLQDASARWRRRNPTRWRDDIIAVHGVDAVPPRGATLSPNGFLVCSYISQGLQFPPTWDRNEIVRIVAYCRERNNVPERDQSDFGTYVSPNCGGWEVHPPVHMRRPLKMSGDPMRVYCPETRSCVFSDKDVAVTAYEKFMAPSTSNDERKKMLTVPLEAFTCAYCDHRPFGRICDRVKHEKHYCKSRPDAPEPSSSEEEESDEDESEEEESEEVVAPPSPKRARFFSWPW